MSELELLFLVLAVVYAWECAWWTRRGTVLFRTWLGRRWRLAHPGQLLGNQQGGFAFAPLLPPLGLVLTGNQPPLSLSPDAVLGYVATAVNPGGRPAQTGRLFRWASIRQVTTAGQKVLVNGELLVKAGSPTFAQHLAGQLDELRSLPESDRKRAIERLAGEIFDREALLRRRDEFLPEIRRVRFVANLLFLWLFIASPVVIRFFGLSRTWPGLLAGVLICTITCAARFRRVHRRIFPQAEDERFTHFLVVLLSPASTMRAHDLLTRPLLENYHPLTIAQVLLPPERFREAAAAMLREARYPARPLFPGNDPDARAAEQNGRETLLRAVESFLRRNNLEPEALLPPPRAADDSCRSYCPRCLTQFVVAEGHCSDCGGLPLAQLAKKEGRP